MTKLDRVSGRNKEGEVSQQEFEEREQRFIKSLGLAGVTTRYLSMYNYCDDTDGKKNRLTSTIPEIDAPLLQFMIQVCDPAITVTNPDFTFTSKGKDWSPKDEVRKRKRTENEQNKQNEETEQVKKDERKNSFYTVKMVIAVFVIIVIIYLILFKFFV